MRSDDCKRDEDCACWNQNPPTFPPVTGPATIFIALDDGAGASVGDEPEGVNGG